MKFFISQKIKLNSMKGVSPLIAMVLVIAFGFGMMAIVLSFVNPLLDKAKDSGIVNEATQNMQLLDSAIKAVASEAKGSKRTISIKVTDGVIRTNGSTERVSLEFTPKARTILDGFAGDVKIESRPVFLEYFNQYNENGNANDSWTAVNGTWSISSGRFLGTGGIAYHNVGNQSSFDLAATIVKSAAPDGHVYVVPGEPKDLVLFLPFDGNINTTIPTAYDYSAYKLNGTFVNATAAACFTNGACPSWVGGIFMNATEYDGLGDYVNAGNESVLRVQSHTISLWAKTNGTAEDHRAMIGKAYGTGGSNSFLIYLHSDETIRGYIETSAGTSDLRGSSLSGNTWYHIAQTYDGSTLKLYVNGVQVNSSSNSGTVRYDDSNVTIGADDNNGNSTAGMTFFFNGSIDEVMIFNRALSSAEILFLYETSLKKITPAGEIQSITSGTAGTINTTLVLASPGTNYFDNIKVKSGAPQITFIIPYQNIDIVNNTRFGQGDHKIVVRHYGTNTTSNRPMIGLEE